MLTLWARSQQQYFNSDPCVHTDSHVKLLEKSVSFNQNNKFELSQGALIWSSFQRGNGRGQTCLAGWELSLWSIVPGKCLLCQPVLLVTLWSFGTLLETFRISVCPWETKILSPSWVPFSWWKRNTLLRSWFIRMNFKIRVIKWKV